MAPMDPRTSDGDKNPSALVLIIASAGSSAPLHLLVSRLTPGHATAYLVVRHASEDTPDEDLLNSLAACSLLPVSTLREGKPPAANWLQLLPVGMELEADGLAIRSREPEDQVGAGLNLDTVLETLATVWGPRLIVIVLSGLGADGVLGLWRVLDTGGQVAALNPRSALFSGMPSAAIQLGGLTAVLDPTGISNWLHQQLSTLESQETESSLALSAELLQHILMVLHERTGVDFSRYKTSTVCRQLQRRLALLKLDDFNDYLRMLQANDLEPEQLKANLLVGVTRFFREGSPFAALRTELEALMANRLALQPLRVWVPGCSSGEEAYSIAMLISALLDHPADLSDRLKIFATDLNDNALAEARRGLYPSACADSVPNDLRQRYISFRVHQIQISRQTRPVSIFHPPNLANVLRIPTLGLHPLSFNVIVLSTNKN